MKLCDRCNKELGKKSYLADRSAGTRLCNACYQVLHKPSRDKKKSYQRTWRLKHPDKVRRIREAEYLTFRGYAFSIYRQISKYAKLWDLPCCKWRDFWSWTENDPTYKKLYTKWIEDRYDRFARWLIDNNKIPPIHHSQVFEKSLITPQILGYSPQVPVDQSEPRCSL